MDGRTLAGRTQGPMTEHAPDPHDERGKPPAGSTAQGNAAAAAPEVTGQERPHRQREVASAAMSHEHVHTDHAPPGQGHAGEDHAGHSHTGHGHAGQRHAAGGVGHAGHAHGPVDYNRAFAIGVTLNTGFVLFEAGYGFLANSLALLADAGHNLGDVLGLLLAWGAVYLGGRPSTKRHTYGLRRSSILAALANALLLLVAVGAIALESVQRLWRPEAVTSESVIWVALVGIAINLGTALLFMRGRETDLNLRGAFLHMAADAAVSLGVVVAGVIILSTGWTFVDPLVGLAIAAAIALSSWSLLRESVALALDAVPKGIEKDDVGRYLASLPGVSLVHHLHIWPMSTTEIALTAHLVRPNAGLDDAFLAYATRALRERFGIVHVTLQVEAYEPVPRR